jgi:hypothetical protein
MARIIHGVFVARAQSFAAPWSSEQPGTGGVLDGASRMPSCEESGDGVQICGRSRYLVNDAG